jgi:signal recognition particle receptor subunit beta
MVQFNFSERTIKAKVVYYGPAQSGKTTNLEQIHTITDPEGTNRLISLNTAQDRTLFFDLLPFSLGAVSGYDFKVQIYTVPGQVQYNATRRVVLAGADAVVFVADSQRAAFKDNSQAFENMKVNLLANRLVPEKVPLVLQLNKQDLGELATETELQKALNFWGRKSFKAVAARGEGVLETFVAVVQEMLAAIAVKYNLKEKGLDPASVPQVVQQAFATLAKRAASARAPGPTGQSAPQAPSPRVVLAQSTDSDKAMPLPPAGGDAGLVSEELLHRAIRSNVDLAETLGSLVREMNLGLVSILSHAELATSYGDEARRTTALGNVVQEAARLRQVLGGLGRPNAAVAAAAQPTGGAAARSTPAAPARPPTAPARPPTAHARPPAPAVAPHPNPPLVAPAPVGPITPRAGAPPLTTSTMATPASTLDALFREAAETAHGALQVNAVAVGLKIAPGAALPRCPPASLRRAVVALLSGLAAASLYGTTIAVRSERKPVLLRTREGEVKRDFIMLAASHGANLGPEAQQRVLQGADPGPLGEAHRLVREMGGFVRFAPLPGGALETRVFLPAA